MLMKDNNNEKDRQYNIRKIEWVKFVGIYLIQRGEYNEIYKRLSKRTKADEMLTIILRLLKYR